MLSLVSLLFLVNVLAIVLFVVLYGLGPLVNVFGLGPWSKKRFGLGPWVIWKRFGKGFGKMFREEEVKDFYAISFVYVLSWKVSNALDWLKKEKEKYIFFRFGMGVPLMRGEGSWI